MPLLFSFPDVFFECRVTRRAIFCVEGDLWRTSTVPVPVPVRRDTGMETT